MVYGSYKINKFKKIKILKKKYFLKYSRYPNGNRADTICGLFTFTATKKKSVLDLVFKFYWSKTDENDVTYEPKSTVNFIDNSGTFYIPGWLPVWTVFIVWTDYENIAVFRACLNSEEYMWIDTRELNPSAKVVKKIKKIIEDYDFDKSKIVRVCTGVKYEFNLD